MKPSFSLRSAVWIAAGAISLGLGTAPLRAAEDVTPPGYGTVTGPAIPSNAPGARDSSAGTDSSLGVTHARSSGPSPKGASLDNNSSVNPEGLGTATGPAVRSDTPGVRDANGGIDSSTGVTHVQSSPSPQPTAPPRPSEQSDPAGR